MNLRQDRPFHLRRDLWERIRSELHFEFSGPLDVPVAERMSQLLAREAPIRPLEVLGVALLYEIGHVLIAHGEVVFPNLFSEAEASLRRRLGESFEPWLLDLVDFFAPAPVLSGQCSPYEYLRREDGGVSGVRRMLHEIFLFSLVRDNAALDAFRPLFGEPNARFRPFEAQLVEELEANAGSRGWSTQNGADPTRLGLGGGEGFVDWFRAPTRRAPHSLELQLEAFLARWADVFERSGLLRRALALRGDLAEESRYLERHARPGGQPGTTYGLSLAAEGDPANYANDRAWMASAVLIAKSTLVWLDQLSQKYGRPIRTFDDIPDEEIDLLRHRGLDSLWLIGIWQRSEASRRIKERAGNPEAAASAYALRAYEVDPDLGGEEALVRFRSRCDARGVRLACDMVPNHTGLDSSWMVTNPDWFIHSKSSPYENYRFTGPDISSDDRIEVRIEDGYWSRSDAAVVFQRVDKRSGETRYVYHGNDGTNMPWNDTAQLDYLRADVREAVMATIVDVCRRFPIVRFDAAMTLAKQHVRRLWYPELGKAPGVPSRATASKSDEAFDRAMPEEFWREVAARVEREAPGSLLLAEAFWMMESYFVRKLGMHRVYNSAFMNMLRSEENAGYRKILKDALLVDVQLLGRYVNFLNNPDEEPAANGFGTGDKYFAACTLLATLPGLPMFGHGQFEGFREKYGMEYRRAYQNESVDEATLARHEREIVPLLRDRKLFSGTDEFRLYDVVDHSGSILEDVYAFSNGERGRSVFVVVNNSPHSVRGEIRRSVPRRVGDAELETSALADTIAWGRRDVRTGQRFEGVIDLRPYAAHVFGDLVVEAPPSVRREEPKFVAPTPAGIEFARHSLSEEALAQSFDDPSSDEEPVTSQVWELRPAEGRHSAAREDARSGLVLARQVLRALAVAAEGAPGGMAGQLVSGRLSPGRRWAAAWVFADEASNEAWSVALTESLGEEGARAWTLSASETASLARASEWLADERATEELATFLGRHEAHGQVWFRREPFVALVLAGVLREGLRADLGEAMTRGRSVLEAAERTGYDARTFSAVLGASDSIVVTATGS